MSTYDRLQNDVRENHLRVNIVRYCLKKSGQEDEKTKILEFSAEKFQNRLQMNDMNELYLSKHQKKVVCDSHAMHSMSRIQRYSKVLNVLPYCITVLSAREAKKEGLSE